MPVFSCVESACIEDLSGVQTLQMLTVETAVLNPRAVFDCICGFSSSCDRKGQ